MKSENTYKESLYNIQYKDNTNIVLYNTFSGALSILDREELNLMKSILSKNKKEFSQDELNFLDKLIINNFIVPNDVNEINLVKEKYNKFRANDDVLSITFLPTLDCNFCCRYCFEGTDKQPGCMSIEVQNRWLQFIKQNLIGKKSLSITWFGGEPTLSLSVIKRMSDRMISYCDKNGIYYSASIITNGYNLTPELIGELYIRRIKFIQITLDGPKEIHNKIRYIKYQNGESTNSFDKIIENINNFTEDYNINTVLRINIEKRNAEQCFQLIDELSEVLKSNKNVSVYFSPIRASTPCCNSIAEHTLEAIEFAELETKLIEYAFDKNLINIRIPSSFMGLCVATNKNGYVATPNGDIHKCWETVSFPEYKIGTLDKSEMVINENYNKWNHWSPFDEKTCKDCKMMPICGGFCEYHFLYPENYSGNTSLSPCPSIKFEIENRLKLYLSKYNLIENC